MIDTKSKFVLKILAKECADGNYKVIETSDIIFSLPKKYRMDSDALKHILIHLERQELISIKYDDEDVFCLAVLPYGFEEIELPNKHKFAEKNTYFASKKHFAIICILSFLGAFLGSLLSLIFASFF